MKQNTNGNDPKEQAQQNLKEVTQVGNSDLPKPALRQLQLKVLGAKCMQNSLQIAVMFLPGILIHQDVIDVGQCSKTVLQSLVQGPLEDSAQILETQWHLDVLAWTYQCHCACQRSTIWMQGNVVVGLAEIQSGQEG